MQEIVGQLNESKSYGGVDVNKEQKQEKTISAVYKPDAAVISKPSRDKESNKTCATPHEKVITNC